ncbi:nucleoside hydrolase [soil metagenome]
MKVLLCLPGILILFLLINSVYNHKIPQIPVNLKAALIKDQDPDKTEQAAVRVIFDTDVGGDVDDAGALAVLHALADRGEIEILAMGVVIGHEAAVPFVHAVNTWYGRPDLPIGTIKGHAPYSRDEYMVPIVEEYPYTLTRETAPEVVKLYRKVLASQPDGSVTLIVVGPATNIYNLLNSAPDENSSLNGVELMRQKIKLYAAGGNGNAGLPKGKCGFNYYTDLASARGELELLPSDFPVVYAGGSGVDLKIGSALSHSRPDHIIRKSYEAYYKGIANDRQTWDQLRVLYGSRPSARNLWDTSPAGNIELSQDSTLTWKATPDNNRAYAYLNDMEAMRDILTELMMYDPRDK